ncbi:MAG: segregation and condensation protein A, partial [Dermatophilaceae bacterium]
MTTTPPETAGGEAPAAQRDAMVPGGILTRRAPAAVFEVTLDVFSGPFDLLLGLIGKHQLDITEIALATVTDEFIAHLRAARETEAGWDLSQASEFLVVAATLLDLKAARLLPQTGPEDEDDLALIEARDLLFARLLQYRAFKDIAHTFGHRMATAGRSHPRAVALEPHLAALLPELVMTITPDQLAILAAQALAPKVPPTVGLSHLHAPAVSVREQAGVIAVRLRRDRVASFRALVADAGSTVVVVARFLALLELFRDASVAFEQAEALGELTVRWTGAEDGDVDVGDEFDEPAST